MSLTPPWARVEDDSIPVVHGKRISVVRLDDGSVLPVSFATGGVIEQVEENLDELIQSLRSWPCITRTIELSNPDAELTAILLGVDVVDASILFESHLVRGTD